MDNLIKKKRRARLLAFQALYQWQLSKTDISEIEVQFRTFHDIERVDIEYFSHLLHEVPAHLTQIEDEMHPFLDRTIPMPNPVELTLLRIGTYELLYCLELPFKIIIDASICLAKEFGAQDGHRYVNGILNKIARKLRTSEI